MPLNPATLDDDPIVQKLLICEPRVRELAQMIARDAHTADDLLQDAYLTALKTPLEDRNLLGWFRIVMNRRHQKSQARERTLRERHLKHAEAQEDRDPVSPGRSGSDPEWDFERVWDALSELPAHYREIVELTYLEDRSPLEVSRDLGVPLSTVYTRQRRALDQLRRRLNPEATERAKHTLRSWMILMSTTAVDRLRLKRELPLPGGSWAASVLLATLFLGISVSWIPACFADDLGPVSKLHRVSIGEREPQTIEPIHNPEPPWVTSALVSRSIPGGSSARDKCRK